MPSPTVSYHLATLEQDGALRRGAGQRHTIVQPADPDRGADAESIDVPLIEQIPAEVPVDAVGLAEEVFALPRPLIGHGTLFVLRITGDSMTGAAIADGDLTVVRQQPVAEN